MKINNKVIIWLSCLAIVWVSIYISNKYEDKINEQFGIRQVTSLQKDVASLAEQELELDADIVLQEKQLKDKKEQKEWLALIRKEKEDKIEEIKTAIYYLNKALWTQTQEETTSE